MTPQQKIEIDNMTQEELCFKWRFARAGDLFFQGDTGEYFTKVMKEKGGMTSEISKKIGW